MQNRRKNYFIKKEFQTKFILKFCILICVACSLMGFLVYILSLKTVTTSFENLHLVAKSTADFILPALVLSSLIAIILISLGCIFIVLFISHRIAGPLYHLEKSVEGIEKGNLTVYTRLREKDEVKILAESLNDMVGKLRKSIAASKEDVKDLENKIVSIRGKLSQLGISQEEIDKVIGPCEDKLKKLECTLSYFKV